MKKSREGINNPKIPAQGTIPENERSRLTRTTWRNWFMVVGVLILTTIGLVTALPPLLSERIVNPWPWVKTDMVLLVGFSLTIIVFVAYMTQQQRHVMKLYTTIQNIQADSALQSRRYAERLYALTSMGRIMGVETNLQKIFNAITKICAETFQSDRASLMLYDGQARELVVKSVCGRSRDEILYIRQKLDDGIAGWVAKNRKPLLLGSSDDSERHPQLKLKDKSIVSAMVAPIIVRDELVGVLNVSSNTAVVTYKADDLYALQVLAENAGVCIRHTEHVNWMKKMCPNLSRYTSTKRRERSRTILLK